MIVFPTLLYCFSSNFRRIWVRRRRSQEALSSCTLHSRIPACNTRLYTYKFVHSGAESESEDESSESEDVHADTDLDVDEEMKAPQNPDNIETQIIEGVEGYWSLDSQEESQVEVFKFGKRPNVSKDGGEQPSQGAAGVTVKRSKHDSEETQPLRKRGKTFSEPKADEPEVEKGVGSAVGVSGNDLGDVKTKEEKLKEEKEEKTEKEKQESKEEDTEENQHVEEDDTVKSDDDTEEKKGAFQENH